MSIELGWGSQGSEWLRRLKRRWWGAAPATAAEGFPAGLCAPLLEGLDADELAELNSLLDWNCFTVDSRGRRFGGAAAEGKRDKPQVIPDRRVLLLDRRFSLADKHVLEVGCFEGVHTIGLCGRAARVTAIDSRVENVVKAIVRTAFYDCHPRVFVCDLERRPLPEERLRADVIFHVGVLYHLSDPVSHLQELSRWAGRGLLLDTHVARAGETDAAYEVGGATYPYQRYREFGREDVFSGMADHSKWLTLDTLVEVLGAVGFTGIQIEERRESRNGARILLTALKSH